ncbi:phosphoribosylanthranilate isomerase [Flavobacterium restrictum]|uniref:N-(5'-phosphoribosyl)anthranilate isomerase n=1 Tax=Flavobacterium restrictum TaxID=2594428 RepID=A0A553E072_9FLAO|nr:phosphoribosylanthranilate isomerase [Flavobacterium restrictum]TRX38292.1 phosphoribosylanthranilate isomerase [Flavobacterium restrictum]
MKLKICGMKYPDNILEVGALLPDYMGFIFWEKSARYFDGIIPELPKSIQKVGVFVNATVEEILEKIEKHDLQAVQLHGAESVAFCEKLKKSIPNRIEIIKVFSILDTFDFTILKPFESVCDFFLFDTKGKLPGGNGTTFDWKVLENYPSTKPFFLSGGIGIEEIKKLVETLQCNVSTNCNVSIKKLPIYAIDVNSKFEIEPGLKNVQLCRDVALQRLK